MSIYPAKICTLDALPSETGTFIHALVSLVLIFCVTHLYNHECQIICSHTGNVNYVMYYAIDTFSKVVRSKADILGCSYYTRTYLVLLNQTYPQWPRRTLYPANVYVVILLYSYSLKADNNILDSVVIHSSDSYRLVKCVCQNHWSVS